MDEGNVEAMIADKIGSRRDVLFVPRVNKPTAILICLSLFGVGFVFSNWLLYVHYGGDQKFYNNFWRELVWSHPAYWSRLQLQYLGSAEPVYRYIVGFGAYYNFDRIVYLSLWNGALVASIGFILLRYRAGLLFSAFVFTNYYLFVLIGPAERLKFAYLFLAIAVMRSGVKWKLLFSIMAVFSHTQAIVQFLSSALYYVVDNRKSIFANRAKAVSLLVGGGLVMGVAGYILITSAGDVITQKAEYYGGSSQGVVEAVQWCFVLLCGLIVFHKRLEFLAGMLPMGMLTALYGNRVNVATLAFVCALALAQRKTNHPLVLVVMAYMSFKTIGFVISALNTGDGFN